MIIGKYFEGDNDEGLKMYQHSCYYDSLRRWIRLAGTRRLCYREDPEWTELTCDWERFREGGSYDHRCIQVHHDLIAAYYRLMQGALSQYIGTDGWPGYFDRETGLLMEDPLTLQLFMATLSYANTKTGYDAEEALVDRMKKIY